MNWEAFLIPITESDTSANEWHNGTLSEWEEYYGKAKKIDKDYYELFVNNQYFIFLVDPKTNIIIAEAYYKKSIHTIDGFIVDSDYRKQGYAEKFIRWCIDNLKINKIRVETDNIAAIKLYKKCGFKIDHTIKKSNTELYLMKL